MAERYTLILDSVKHFKWHHDVGFMIDWMSFMGRADSGPVREAVRPQVGGQPAYSVYHSVYRRFLLAHKTAG